MKKKITTAIAATLLTLGLLTGCGNHVVFDTTFSYDRVQIRMMDGTVIEGEVQGWSDYEGDQIQVKVDDVTYLTHVNNVVLIAE